MTIQGLDVSSWQPAMPWTQFAAAGRAFVIVKASEANWVDPHLSLHTQGAKAAGLEVGWYHFIRPGNGADQARTFNGAAYVDDTLLFGCPRYWVDVESGTYMAVTLAEFLSAWQELRLGIPIGIYTGQGAWASVVGHEHTEFGAYPLWCASNPLPAGWSHAVIQQNPVAGHLPGYAGDLDLDEIPGVKPMTVPIVAAGPKIGIHSINPGNTLALVQRAVDAGWHWPVVKIINDASVCVGVKATSPATITICRYLNPNPNYEALQGVENWTPDQRAVFAKVSIQHIFDNANTAQLAATDYWGVINEPVGRGAYTQVGLALIELVKEADRRGVKLALPASPQGVPEWSDYVDWVNTGLFGLMKKGGHILDVHEGVFTDQPIDYGFGDAIPGSPVVSGAGSTNFRHRYLYSLLESRGEVVPLLVSEFYGGGRYTNPPSDQLARFAWYDQRARAEPYLLAFLPFTVNPNDGWKNADYTPTYESPELWAYIASEKDKPNGETIMPFTQTMKDNLLAGTAALAATINAIPVDGHVWKAGDVALALADPLSLYTSPGASNPKQIHVTWDMNVAAVSPDLQWLEVLPAPALWVRSQDVKPK
jgi:lysozyme